MDNQAYFKRVQATTPTRRGEFGARKWRFRVYTNKRCIVTNDPNKIGNCVAMWA